MLAIERLYSGDEAIEFYLDHKMERTGFALARDILATSYFIHLGEEGSKFISICFDQLTSVMTTGGSRDLKKIFENSREKFRSFAQAQALSSYKAGSLSRTFKVTGAERLSGNVADIGAGNNALGKLILESNSMVKKFVGVDVIQDGVVEGGERLTFVREQGGNDLPLDSNEFDSVILRFSLHHMTPEQQTRRLQEAYRILKIGGCAIIIEDTYSNELRAFSGNHLNERFMQLGSEKSKLCVLGFLDASSCFTTLEKMPFAFSFRSMEEWGILLENLGFRMDSATNWGIPFFSLFQAPMGVLIYRKK
jgi:ubiquinone/menaquinone biosynthesis C-methylase UbiE